MKLLEYEAKKVFRDAGIPTPENRLIDSPEEADEAVRAVGEHVVLKAQVDVGGRGKAGGILKADAGNAAEVAGDLFSRKIRGLPVNRVLVEERLDIGKEYYLSVAIDRSSRCPVVLFAEAGGVEIENAAACDPCAVRRECVSPLLPDIPQFQLRDLAGSAPAGVKAIINTLYRVFREKDALLAEINPLVVTMDGEIYAADAKLIIDDNALGRQGITVNRDLTPREQRAEELGFSYVELEGSIGVIGNGAGLTMSTLDLIGYYGGKAANFLDVGGGADRERVREAVRLVAGMAGVRVIVVNLLGGITRCDEVARGILEADVSQPVILRLAGTNEEEGRAILAQKDYRMLDSMDAVIRAAVEESK